MLAHRKRSSNDPDLVGRIDSEHLSEQFQRDLSSSPGDDLLQNDLKLDDISNASGLRLATLCGVRHKSRTPASVHTVALQGAAWQHLRRHRSPSRSSGLNCWQAWTLLTTTGTASQTLHFGFKVTRCTFS